MTDVLLWLSVPWISEGVKMTAVSSTKTIRQHNLQRQQRYFTPCLLKCIPVCLVTDFVLLLNRIMLLWHDRNEPWPTLENLKAPHQVLHIRSQCSARPFVKTALLFWRARHARLLTWPLQRLASMDMPRFLLFTAYSLTVAVCSKWQCNIIRLGCTTRCLCMWFSKTTSSPLSGGKVVCIPVALPASTSANTPAEGNQRFHLRTESF